MRTFIYAFGLLLVALALVLFWAHIHFQPYLFFCGGGITGLGVWILYQQITFFGRSQLAFGKLIAWNEAPRIGNGGTPVGSYYYAVVAFETTDGTEHQVTSATGSYPKPKTPLGKKFPVRYNPENPEEARLDTLFDYWGPAVLILILGASSFLVSFHAGHSR